MSQAQSSSKVLPPNPSTEYLRKEAKRLAHDEAIQLSAAQRRLAQEYGYWNWAELMNAVQAMVAHGKAESGRKAADPPRSPQTGEKTTDLLPCLPLRGLIAFPYVSYPIFVGRPTSIRAVQHAQEYQLPLLLAAQKDPSNLSPSSSDMYQVGTVGGVIQPLRLPDRTIKTVIEAKRRVRVGNFVFDQDFSKAHADETRRVRLYRPEN
jgi:hypothetical protein